MSRKFVFEKIAKMQRYYVPFSRHSGPALTMIIIDKITMIPMM